MARASRNSKDPNLTAFSIEQQVTNQGAAQPAAMVSALDNAELRRQLMREMGRRGGKKGGKARAANMNAAQRKSIAKKAAKARWGKAGKVSVGRK